MPGMLPPAAPLEIPPPPRRNAALALGIVGLGVVLQALAARQHTGLGVLAVGVVYAFLFLPQYSLLHEAEHRIFHGNEHVNDAFGVLLAAFFPGSFTFLRACHLGHHRRNRSDAEMFDLYYPTDNLLWKRAYFYGLYLGGFWLSVPVATVLLILWPGLLRNQLVQDSTSAAAMVNGIPKPFLRRIRLECVGTVLLHAGMYVALDLRPGSYLALYALAGINWSAQQYINHAESPRHVLNGAHNLKPHPLYEALLLNFNWHLAHHQHPKVPWLHLPRFDDPSRVRPGYLGAFVRFWRGPRPCHEPPPARPHEEAERAAATPQF